MATLEDLEARVAALEGASGSGAAGLAPNYLQVDPVTGKITADFSGVIDAQGVVIQGAPSNTVTDQNRIRWNDVNGVMIADIAAYTDQTSITELQTNVFADTAGKMAEYAMNVFESGAGSGNAGIAISSQNGPNASRRVSAYAQTAGGVADPTIIDGNGHSDFAQAAATGTLTRVGDPFYCYASGAQPSGSWGPGVGEHFEAWFASVTITVDPGNRHAAGSKARYVCRNTGVYLVFGELTYAASTAGGQVALVPTNLSSGYSLGHTQSTSQVIGDDGMSTMALIPANAGDVLTMKSAGGFAFDPATVGYNSFPGTTFGVVQVA